MMGKRGPARGWEGAVKLFGVERDESVTGCGVALIGVVSASREKDYYTSFKMVNLVFISCRYWAAVSRWRRGGKCGDILLNADRNRWAPPIERNRFLVRSRCLGGWWEFAARLVRYFDRRCSTLLISRRWATP